MEIFYSCRRAVAAAFAISFLFMSGTILVSGQQQCQVDLQGLITQCAAYVQKLGLKSDPSPACCDVVKTIDFPCACKYVTAAVETLVDMDKAVHVAAVCGKPLAHGTKCGSYTVP